MTKAELEQIMNRTDLYDMIMRACPSMRHETEQERQQLVNAMVEAYNQAIDDSVEEVGWYDQDIIRDNIKSLKI